MKAFLPVYMAEVVRDSSRISLIRALKLTQLYCKATILQKINNNNKGINPIHKASVSLNQPSPKGPISKYFLPWGLAFNIHILEEHKDSSTAGIFYRNSNHWDLSGGPGAKTSGSQCTGSEFNPWSGNQIPYVATKTQHSQIKIYFLKSHNHSLTYIGCNFPFKLAYKFNVQVKNSHKFTPETYEKQNICLSHSNSEPLFQQKLCYS